MGGAWKVTCQACGWRGTRTRRDTLDPNRASDVGGFGSCRCGGGLRRAERLADLRIAKAKAELRELAEGARL